MVCKGFLFWLFTVLGLAVLLRRAAATGYVDIRPTYFHNSHGLDSSGAACDYHAPGCDHYFHFCLTGYGDGGCNYGSRVTPHAENTYLVDFTGGALGATPFRFTFHRYPGSFKLTVYSYDDDGSSSLNPDDPVDTTEIRKIMDPGESSRGEYYGTRGQTGDRRTRLDVEFTVGCDPNYYGSSCDILCEPQDDSVNGHYTCGSQGQKICREGWTDPFTNCLTPVCRPVCSRGTCTAPNTCSCEDGYQGPLCGSPVCAAGCVNGWCTVPGECRCNPGYSGFLCTVDERFCERQNPCTNGGTCMDTGPNQYMCNCPYGYNGTNCNSTYEVCSVPDFCANGGSCTSGGGVGQFECTCPSGYTGERCEELVDNCVSGVCLNGGECVNAHNNFSCRCAEGFTGEFCGVNIDDCASNPCKNGGECIDEANDYYCVCRPYASVGNPPKDCSGPPCMYHQCENDGVCSDGSGKAACQCKPDYVGEFCDFNKTSGDSLSAGGEQLSERQVLYVAVGCSVGGVFVCLFCIAFCLCCIGCYRNRKYHGEGDVEDAQYDAEQDSVAVAMKIKEIEINNPQYASADISIDHHIYDHVTTIRRDNPYEDVSLSNPPGGYSTLNGTAYGNTSPTSCKPDHTYPEVAGKKNLYDTPAKMSVSSSGQSPTPGILSSQN